jgi:hypothetical protein
MGERKKNNYKNSQEYIKLQGEITRLNTKLQDLYEKKKKIKFFDDKMSKINKIYMIMAVSFEILALILTKGLLLLIQSFVVVGVSFIGIDTSKKVYDEEKKLKADNAQIDIDIENTEAELKIARGNLEAYVKKQQRNNESSLEKVDVKSMDMERKFNVIYSDTEERDASNYPKVKTLEKNDNDN